MTTAAFLAGVGALVQGAGIAVYDPDRTWTDADTQIPIFEGDLPESPSKVIGMLAYTIKDDPKLTDSIVAVQFKIRGDETHGSVTSVNDALFDALHGLHDTVVGGVPVVLAYRQNSVPGGRDGNSRYLHNASFYWMVTWPSQYRED